VGSYTIAEALKQVRQNPRVGAVVLRIDSGGGSAMAADVIWREVKITAKEKPVIVSMAGAAASGGYYAAVPATRIFANPLTVTGSIGIFYGKADVTGLLAKLGITVEVYRTAPRADAESIFRPYTDDERRELEHKVDQFYDMFLGRVAEGRKVSKSSVDAVGRGRVWTGEQAYARKLVDELGGLRQAIAYARRIADLPEYGPIYELPKETTWIGQLLGIEGVHDGEARARSALPAQVWQLARALAPFTVYPGDTPLARIELVSVEP
jgi:protease-4